MNGAETLGLSECRERAAQLRAEIVSWLGTAETPLTARELMDACDSAESVEKITNALGYLQRAGIVEKAGIRTMPILKRGDRPTPVYRLVGSPILAPDESARLAAAIETQLADTQWPDALEGNLPRTARMADAIEATDQLAWSHVGADAHDGDEFEHACPPFEGPIRGFSDPPEPNFAARYIRNLEDPEPRLLEGRWIAELLGAVAARLEAGRSLPPDPEAARLLRQAEQILLECAA